MERRQACNGAKIREAPPMARKLPAMIAEPPAVMLRGNGSMEFLHPFPIP